jgi:hypothetical protein
MAMAYSGGFNIDKLRVSLFRKADMVEEAVEAAVEIAAQLIADEAKANVPVDTHNLEEAIHVANRQTRRGNHAVDIEVSGPGSEGRDVEEYAMEVHESYQNMTPGPGTIAKRAADPTHYVGEKYMERAVETKKKEAVEIVKTAVKIAVKK